jgi:hypothetical protein
MRRRREWAEWMPEAYMVLWWIAAGELPTVEEAKDRLEHLREHGPSPTAFTFKKRYSPDEAAVASPEDERNFCTA